MSIKSFPSKPSEDDASEAVVRCYIKDLHLMNAAVTTWQTFHPEYTINKELSIVGGTLHFINKN